jgi:hypothetical protein
MGKWGTSPRIVDRSNGEIRGPRSHADLGRYETSLVNGEPAVSRRLDYAHQWSRANFERQGSSLRKREPGSAKRNAVSRRVTGQSGNVGSGPACNPSIPRARRH